MSGKMHLKEVWKGTSLPAPQVDRGLLMLPAPITISKGQTQDCFWPWMTHGSSSPWMAMVWPTALGQEHQLVIETPVGLWL
jgi:hypothetical protein